MILEGVWGLTGGIAAGKSTFALALAHAGLAVLDADSLAREISSEGGLGAPLILERFGTLDRARLREIVFGDEAARRELEGIMHPLIVSESFRRLEALRKAAGIAIYEASLLVETGRFKSMVGVILVEAPLETRIARLMKRDQVDRAHAERIIDAQLTDSARRQALEGVRVLEIFNDGQLDLRAAAAQVSKEIKKISPR